MRGAVTLALGCLLLGCGGKIVDDLGEPAELPPRRHLARGGVVELRASPSLTAEFWDNEPLLELTEFRDGSCEGWTASLERVGPQPRKNGINAGVIRATGPQGALEAVFDSTTDFGDDYGTARTKDGPWTGDGPIEVRVAGSSAVPGFTRTLTMPPKITVTAPRWTRTPKMVPSRSLTIALDRDLDLVWQGARAGHEVVVRLRTVTLQDVLVTRFYAECRFPAEAGGARVPRSTLTALHDSELALRASYGGEHGTDITIESEVLRAADRRGFLVKVRAVETALTDDGESEFSGGGIEFR